jgi:hypothetical protein
MDKSTLTHPYHLESIVYIRVHSCHCAFNRCMYLLNAHIYPYNIIQSGFAALNILCAVPSHPSHTALLFFTCKVSWICLPILLHFVAHFHLFEFFLCTLRYCFYLIFQETKECFNNVYFFPFNLSVIFKFKKSFFPHSAVHIEGFVHILAVCSTGTAHSTCPACFSLATVFINIMLCPFVYPWFYSTLEPRPSSLMCLQ